MMLHVTMSRAPCVHVGAQTFRSRRHGVSMATKGARRGQSPQCPRILTAARSEVGGQGGRADLIGVENPSARPVLFFLPVGLV